jgi:hypothetical protein
MIDASELLTRLAARHSATLPETLIGCFLRDAVAFGLERPDDVQEVFDLWLSLTERVPSSLYVRGMLRVVLSNKRWPVARRIAFLRRHLADREITPADDAAAPMLFGTRQEQAT